MRIERRTRIEAAPDRLWKLLTETDLIRQWLPSLVSDDPITSGPVDVGYRSRMKLKEGSKVVEYESTIEEYQPPSRLRLVLKGGSLGAGPMSVDYEISPDAEATMLHFRSAWKPHGFMLRIMHPLITFMAGRNATDSMRRLKSRAESEEPV